LLQENHLQAIVTSGPSPWTPFRFLGLALAISVVLAFPVEQVEHDFALPGLSWSHQSCEDLTNDLNLGSVLQAIVVPIFLFLLPGPGSLFQKNTASALRRSAPAGTPPPTISGASRNSMGKRRPSVAIPIALLVLSLAMFLGSGLLLRSWIFDNPGARVSSPVAYIAATAFLGLRFVLGLFGLGASIYLLRRQVSWEPASFIAAGGSFAAVVAVAWWYWLREYAGLHGVCPDLFDRSGSRPFHVDHLSDCAHYFVYVSVFSALWVGISAGALRLQSARAAERGSRGKEFHHFQGFFWTCFLGWAVQYRVSQWFALSNPHGQEWPLFATLNFLTVTVSSLWVLAFSQSLWNQKPRSWLRAIFQAYWRTFAILLLTLLSFFWLFIYAIVPLVAPIATWNVFGLAWALTVGTWRWRALRKERLTAVVRQP
jgi:hypothetical protein